EVVGGDLGVQAREALPEEFALQARQRGLAAARRVSFPSVLFHGESSQMATVKGVDAAHPLRGRLRVASDSAGLQARDSGGPPPGEAFADPRVLAGLGVGVGDSIELGTRQVRIGAVLLSEPDASGGLLEMAPPLLVHHDDVDAAGLLGPGSRASYRLMFAGRARAVEDMRQWLQPQLQAGQRLVGVEDAQQGLRTACERAGRFLALAALLAVLLASVATALAANRFAL